MQHAKLTITYCNRLSHIRMLQHSSVGCLCFIWKKIKYMGKFAHFVSSNVNEVIRVVLNSLFFLQKDFWRTQNKNTSQAKTN